MSVTLKVKYGSSASANPAVSTEGTPFFVLPGTCLERQVQVGIDRDTVSKHMLLIGGTGSGKSNLMYRLVDQTIKAMQADDVTIIFDSKGDFYKKFKDRGNTAVIGNSASYEAISQKWNIFDEVLADGAERDKCRINAMEISRSLFAQRMSNTTNAFFPSAAQDVFSSLLVSITRDAETDPDARAHMNNRDLSAYLQSSEPDELCTQLTAYPDLRAAASYIVGDNEQAQGVISEMYSVIRDLFIGVFEQKGGFSMRRFVRARGRKILFLEYDPSIGSVLTPVYRLLIDLALKESLSQHNKGGNIFFFFDEFKLLPHLQHIDDAVNFGRSKGVKVFAGLQSIEQLYDLYGQSRGRSIAAGFSTVIAFHANDEATMRYVSGIYGKNLMVAEVIGANNAMSTSIYNGSVVEDWQLCGLLPGQALICLPSTPPFFMTFREYK